MNNFGTLTFVLSIQTDHALTLDKVTFGLLKQLAQRHCLETLRPEVLMNGPKPLKTLTLLMF